MIRPLSKIAVPAPVPSVSTISTPLPRIAPKPWTSASFMTRTGFFQRLASAACRSKPVHGSVPRWGAVSTRPPRSGGIDRGDQPLGRDRRRRGRDANRLADHLSGAVEHGELDPGAADIDG